MSDLYQKGMEIAKAGEISTPTDRLVLYSISYLPTSQNKDEAFAFLASHPEFVMIDQTPCGVKLVEMGLLTPACGLNCDEIATIWKVASKRLIEQASGNVTAFVKNADKHSVFRTQELPELLKNSRIKTINQQDKFQFSTQFTD